MKTKAIILTTAGTALAFAFVWEQIQATRLGYAVSRQRTELRKRRARTGYLRLELARLKAPARLAEEARRRLSMTPPQPESVVVLGSTVPRLIHTKNLHVALHRGRPPISGAGPPAGGRMASLIGGSAR